MKLQCYQIIYFVMLDTNLHVKINKYFLYTSSQTLKTDCMHSFLGCQLFWTKCYIRVHVRDLIFNAV